MARGPGLVCNRLVYSLVLLLLVLLLARSEPAKASSQDSAPVVPAAAAKQGPEDEVIVKFRRGAAASDIAAAHTQNAGAVSRTIPQTGAQVVKVPAGEAKSRAAAYARLPQVESAEVNGVYPMIGLTSDPMVSQQWQYNNTGQSGGTPGADIDAFEAWDITTGSPSVAVAILDTGIDKSHVDLASKVTKRVNFSTSSSDDDKVGHGTHVAGTVAAITNNAAGVAGTCPQCTLYSVKVLDDSGNGTFADVATGIIWAADNGAKVINMSLGDTVPSTTVEDAINYAWSKGVVIVAGAGNNGNSVPFYPAYYTNVISVAATDRADAKASFSTFGSWVNVSAPGADILSTAPDHPNLLWLFPVNYATASGTSMASPHVAGIAGSCGRPAFALPTRASGSASRVVRTSFLVPAPTGFTDALTPAAASSPVHRRRSRRAFTRSCHQPAPLPAARWSRLPARDSSRAQPA